MSTAVPRAVRPGGTIAGEAPLRVVPVRRWGQWLVSVIVLLLAALLVQSVATNPNFEWAKVWGYFLDGRILRGLGTTLWLTVVAMLIGVAIGVIMAVGRQSRNVVVSGAASAYVGFFRGTPLLVQLIFWFNLAALYPTLQFGIPFGPVLAEADTNTLITPMLAAILGLGLNEGAYMSEIVRAGLLSVDPGQTDAAEALGMRRRQIFRRIVLPQAMRVIIPPTGNETISMLKTTALVSVIAIGDLLFAAQTIYSRNFEVIPLLITVSIWYLLVTTVLSVGQHFVERRFTRGDRRAERSYLVEWLEGLVPRHAAVAPTPATGPIDVEGGRR
ncbi:amino acid ABC transporter permease [Microbacterium sp. cf332]|uniref:amino acid ABC transporter permease n=1 Tax=Microbacterium sp. cf332 TaxID=1761804 RepID=UPI0008877E28|nr:amino acid ABC transporter permease [Microbacterium sp. cf332]SDQ13935.1 amino acid ABC transporter membrane protein, PAAT family (TC 3.A.1.3.-) [Microbacterium sp. cf332]